MFAEMNSIAAVVVEVCYRLLRNKNFNNPTQQESRPRNDHILSTVWKESKSVSLITINMAEFTVGGLCQCNKNEETPISNNKFGLWQFFFFLFFFIIK
jgi:hypothetical protein